jgi:hypothetical protein
MKLLFLAMTFFATPSLMAAARTIDPEATAKLEEITGLKGKLNEKGDVFKVTQPRVDAKISVDGWKMPPFMGLTSWAAFAPGKKNAFMVMGDLVLFQDEVNPVMSALLDRGLEVTALHNHFFYDDPKVYFMHIAGEGDIAKLAGAVRGALDKVRDIRQATPSPAHSFGDSPISDVSSITVKTLETILEQTGESKNGMFKAVFGRKTKMPCGCEVEKDMGVNTWAAFAGTDDNAIVDGDFAVLETELQAVLRTLRQNAINIVAIHHHMTEETPRILFLHYWGRGKAVDLARAVKASIATQKN